MEPNEIKLKPTEGAQINALLLKNSIHINGDNTGCTQTFPRISSPQIMSFLLTHFKKQLVNAHTAGSFLAYYKTNTFL